MSGKDPRTLRSKHLRNALWTAYDGKCCRCGRDLPDDWHADHVVPYSVTGRTNVHEMQPLCPECNLRKGAMTLRSHQHEFDRLCQQIASRAITVPDFIFPHVAPGGGKSSLPVIAAHYLIEKAKMADKICWVVPNGALREQAVKAFGRDRWEAEYYGHSLEIASSTNVRNPSKGSAGYVTTYKALCSDSSEFNLSEFRLHKYILVLDEIHHLALESSYCRAVKPLVSQSFLVVGMTGTIERSDRLPIYMLPYNSQRFVDKSPVPGIHWVNYGIHQATMERSIVRVHFSHVDGAAKWKMVDGSPGEAETLGDSSEALFTALKTEYARHLLDACLNHWLDYRRTHKRSKMLVVCADTDQARDMLAHLHGRNVRDAEIATYKEDYSDESIARYRDEETPTVLVTVAKAYEGLDVPAITHLACLTHIRSKPWIEQMLARGWRYDPKAGPWDSQIFHAFVPADDAMNQIIQGIESEQQQAVRDTEEKPRSDRETSGHDNGSVDQKPATIIPLSSSMTGRRSSEMNGDKLGEEDTELYESIAHDQGLCLTAIQVKGIIEAWNNRPQQSEPKAKRCAPEPSLDRRLEASRETLTGLVRSAARGDGPECATINGQIKSRFGPREAMTEQQLMDAIQLVRTLYRHRL